MTPVQQAARDEEALRQAAVPALPQLPCGATVPALSLPDREGAGETQVEALTMIAAQAMANDFAVAFGGAGYPEMNVYKPLIIDNVMKSIAIMSDGCVNFCKYLVEGTKPNGKKIAEDSNGR